MEVIQVNLVVPDEIAEGLESGIFERVGGIIKETTGKKTIVKWLKDAPEVAQENEKDLINQAVGVIKNNKNVVIISSALALVALAGGMYYLKSKKNTTEQDNTFLKDFVRVFDEYLTAAKKGELTEEIIDAFKNDLKKVRVLISKEEIRLSPEYQKLFINFINLLYEFTVDFALKNEYVVKINKPDNDGLSDNLIKLEDYLNIQKDIFDTAH